MNTITVDDYQVEVLKEIVHEHLLRRIEQAQDSCEAGHVGCVASNLEHLECVVDIQRQIEWALPCNEPAVGDACESDSANHPGADDKPNAVEQ